MREISGIPMTPAHQRPVAPNVATQAAAQWCARLHAEDCTAAERIAFERWLAADPSHAEEYRLMAQIWEVVDYPPRSAAPRKTLRRFAAAAALGMLALPLAAWLGWSQGWLPNSYQAFESQGSRQQVVLGDGSTVELNLNSRLIYTRYIHERRVTLKAGEAFFEVRHDAEHPFVVRAGQRQVKVTGTRFNVWKYQSQVRVTLVEGSVIVSGLAGKDSHRLEPGMQARYPAGDAEPQLRQVGAGDNSLAWRNGKLVLDDLPLADALPLLNRYLDKPLVLADNATGAIRIGGIFNTAEVAKLVGNLPKVLPVYLTRDKAGGTVLNGISPRPKG